MDSGDQGCRKQDTLKKHAFVVLGMHRSGTSSVAGVLTLLGAAPPKTLMAAAADNPKGFFESRLVGELNDRILGAAGSSWDDWRRFDPGALLPAAGIDLRDQIQATLRHEFGDDVLVVLKDPRLCRIFPIWENVLEEEGYQAKFVLPVRSPLEVARSLNRRNGMPIATGLLLWLRHVLDGERLSRNKPRRILLWRAFMQNWRAEVALIQEALDWKAEMTEECAVRVDGFLTADLQHEVVSDEALGVDPAAHAWALEVYGALTGLAAGENEAAHHAVLDKVGAVFELSCQLHGAAQQPLIHRVSELATDRMALLSGAEIEPSVADVPSVLLVDALAEARAVRADRLTVELQRRGALGTHDVFEFALERSEAQIQRIRRVRDGLG